MECKLILGLALLLSAAFTHAQTYPAKPIRIVVPSGPAGGIDSVTRMIAAKVAESVGQPVVVDNRPGAAGSIALEIAARSSPDGYTLAVLGASQVIYPMLVKTAYDLVRDFTPVSQTATAPYLLVVHPALPAQSVGELIAHAKANPDKLNYASLGNGSLQHLSMELFATIAGIRVFHVPYQVFGVAFPDLLSNRVQMAMASVTALVPHVRSKGLRPLAVTGTRRIKELPELPTMVEAGVPGFVVTQWQGVLGPGGMPRPVVERLHRELAKAAQHPEIVARLEKDSTEAVGSTPAAFSSMLKDEHAKWSGVIKRAGLKAE